jgi:hypothetical protein
MRNYRWSEIPKPPGDDSDPLDLIKALLSRKANLNMPLVSPIPCRGPSNFSNVFQSMVGATPFLRAAESGDITLVKFLVDHGADPNIKLADGTTAAMLAAGAGRSDGSTYEWSEAETLEAVNLCLQLGNDLHAANAAGLTRYMVPRTVAPMRSCSTWFRRGRNSMPGTRKEEGHWSG